MGSLKKETVIAKILFVTHRLAKRNDLVNVGLTNSSLCLNLTKLFWLKNIVDYCDS